MSDPRRRKIPQRQLQPRLRCLFLSAKEMEKALVKERMRCDRYRQWFSLIVIEPRPCPKRNEHEQLLLLGKYLRRRLRLTDERGMLLKGGVGVMLPMTDVAGARRVLRDIVSSMHDEGISLQSNIFCYDPAPSQREPGPMVEPEIPEHSDVEFHPDAVGQDAVLRDAVTDSTPAQSSTAATTTTRTHEFRPQVGYLSSSTAEHVLVHHPQTPGLRTYLAPSFPPWKRLIDVVGSMCGIVVAAPVLATAGIAIKISSRGPVFFRQVRAGQFGRPFTMYKLRTMVANAEELKSTLLDLNERDGPAFKMKNDPRVTKLGHFLRKTGIDEIPQLWNVLKGDMSIVGPRPLPCHEDRDCEHWHRQRLDTKPGLTCIWQISKSRDVSFEEWMRMDLRYTRSRTLRHDITLMFKTIGAVLLGRVGH